jgi:hypothetical protein
MKWFEGLPLSAVVFWFAQRWANCNQSVRESPAGGSAQPAPILSSKKICKLYIFVQGLRASAWIIASGVLGPWLLTRIIPPDVQTQSNPRCFRELILRT